MSDGYSSFEQVKEETTTAFSRNDPRDALRRAVAQVMDIQDITLGDERTPIRIRGKLLIPPHEAFRTLRPLFEAVEHTPLLRREDGLDVVHAMPGVFGKARRRTPWVAIVLLALTVISVFWVGLRQGLNVAPLDAFSYILTGKTLMPVPVDRLPTPEALGQALLDGVLYTLALLGILGAHEMGHYLMARRYGVHTTVPFFIPLPISILGTLGAVIAMREPAPNRRVQFDIGIAGPLAGLVVAVPVMVAGLLLSEVRTTQDVIREIPPSLRGAVGVEISPAFFDAPVPETQFGFIHEGNSLLYLAMKYVIFGKILPQGNLDVWVHPVAFAAWAGFLVTALNLLPIGQLDGGHILFGLFGSRMRAVRRPIVVVLIVLALIGTLNEMGLSNLSFGWSGWWVWIGMIVFLLRDHAPVLDEITELDSRRRALGVVMLIVFVLIFTPRPLGIDAGPVAELIRGLI